MTSNTVNDGMRSTQSVAIRWKRYLSDLAATQPPPPPAIVGVTGNGRVMAARRDPVMRT
jgi:hypothetical protein